MENKNEKAPRSSIEEERDRSAPAADTAERPPFAAAVDAPENSTVDPASPATDEPLMAGDSPAADTDISAVRPAPDSVPMAGQEELTADSRDLPPQEDDIPADLSDLPPENDIPGDPTDLATEEMPAPSEGENDTRMPSSDPEEEPPLPVSAEERLPEPEFLLSCLEKRQYNNFRAALSAVSAPDAAELMEQLPAEYHPVFFRLLPKEQAAEVFVEMDHDLQETLIGSFTDRELSEMLSELYLDDTVDIIEEMPANVVKRILRNSTAQDRDAINRLLNYPKDSAGTIMTTEYVRFTREMTVERALTHIRRVAIDKETIYTCYITDKNRHLEGIVTAKSLLISPLDAPLSSIMEENVIFVRTTDDKEEVAQKFDRYGFLSMPVVDGENRLVGIVTFDDAISVIHEEAEEDFAKMAAITPSETTYLKTGVLSIWKARIPWLLLLMVSATFSSMILSRFEMALPAVLVLFVPMLMDTGGNSGGQSSVTVIRGLSLGEVRYGDVLRVLAKEAGVGALCGVTLGAVAFGKVMLVDRLIMSNPAVTWYVALAVATSLCLCVVVAKIIGCSLPILAKRIGFDPAVMASPFITTVVDAIALLLYFFMAKSVFHL